MNLDNKQSPKNSVDFVPKSFKLQWHITERCNFRCRHCYQESYNTPELTFEQMSNVLDQYVELVKKWQIPRNRAFLTITGGEPFLREDFFQFLAKVYKYTPNLIWSILSNGSFINRENIKILKSFDIGAYQVSLEGLEEANDKIRGKGNYKKAIDSIKLLVNEGIYTVVSLTFTKESVQDVVPLAHLLAKIGVRDFLIRRLVPRGQGSEMGNMLLGPEELFAFYQQIIGLARQLYQEKYQMKISFCCESPFFVNTMKLDSTPLLVQRGEFCTVTRGLIMALLPDGAVLPCRRLPIVIGNILENSFEEIYYSLQMKSLRDKRNLPKLCQKCLYFGQCFGGGRCITYACANRLDLPDPQCWHAINFKRPNLDDQTTEYRRVYNEIIKDSKSFKKILKEIGLIIKNRL